jgi:hypothetical protein
MSQTRRLGLSFMECEIPSQGMCVSMNSFSNIPKKGG